MLNITNQGLEDYQALYCEVMENLESRGIFRISFLALERPEIEVWVMESHGKAKKLSENEQEKKK